MSHECLGHLGVRLEPRQLGAEGLSQAVGAHPLKSVFLQRTGHRAANALHSAAVLVAEHVVLLAGLSWQVVLPAMMDLPTASLDGKKVSQEEKLLPKVGVHRNMAGPPVLGLPGLVVGDGEALEFPIDISKLQVRDLTGPHARIDHDADDGFLPSRETVP